MKKTKLETVWTVQYCTQGNSRHVSKSPEFDSIEKAVDWYLCNRKKNWYSIAIRSKTVSTHDVPGARASNNDELAIGCWAEHDDGSLIFVESTENGRVIYSIFDVNDPDNPVEYRDSMSIRAFKKEFSWDVKKKKSIKWTWHDKTPFPWDRIIELGGKDGVRYPSADHLLTAAQKVARSRDLRGSKLDPDDYSHLSGGPTEKAANAIMKGIQRAIEHLSR